MRKSLFILLTICLFSSFIMSCSKSDDTENNENPFDKMESSDNNSRDKIVIISDIHLGADLSYSENIKHLSRLEQFINEVRASNTVKELVIGGDMIDGWYVPTRTNTYSAGSQLAFVKKIASSNKVVISAINNIISDGIIKVTYVPGNHDMLFNAADVEAIMPGINQARDSDKPLLGTYYPDGYPQVAIEHGHRYDFFCNLDPFDNQTEAPGTILPPGYFFARIAANSFVKQVSKNAATKVKEVTINSADIEQKAKYLYYYGWKYALENLIWVDDNFDENIFTTNIDGFTNTYSMNDFLPYNDASGKIQIKMYGDAFTQAAWEKRLKYNNAPIMTNVADAVIGSLITDFIDNQSDVQYFHNPSSKVRVVVFGHTHIPMIKTFTNLNGDACVYANTGTWEDKKVRKGSDEVDQDSQNMHFVVIMPREDSKNKLFIGLFQYNHGEHILKDSQNILL